MEPQRTTRYAWKALKGLKSLRLTPTTSELPPSIRYTLDKDEATRKYFQHAMDQTLQNGGITTDFKHADHIQVNLFESKSSTTILDDHTKNTNDLLQTLLDSKETKFWNPELKQLLVDVREAEDPVQAFELMSQRMEPQTRALLLGLIQNSKNSQSSDAQQKQQSAEEEIMKVLRAERENFLKVMEATQKSSNVIDDLLIKRLDSKHIEQQLRESYERRMKSLETTNPFDRVEAEFNTLNPIEAYMEASKLFHKLGETNADTNEAEAMRRITKIEQDFSHNYESLYKKEKKGQKLSPVAARYKAMTESLRTSAAKTLDAREEEHLKRYYAQVKNLPPISFVSFSEILNIFEIQPLIQQYKQIRSGSNDKKQLGEIVSTLRENLKQQWETYLQYTAPLRELNKKFTEEQKSYLSPEEHQIATLQLERDNLLLELHAADFYNADVSKIASRINQVDGQAREILFKQAEQAAAGNSDVIEAVQIVRKLVQADLKLRETAEYKQQLAKYQNPHSFMSFFHPEDTQEQLNQLQANMAAQLSKEIDAVLSKEKLQTLTAGLKKFIHGLDTTLSQPREQLTLNTNKRRNVYGVYELLQKFGIKQSEVQVSHLQKAAKSAKKTEQEHEVLKQVEELTDILRSEIISKNSIQEGLMSLPVLEKITSITQNSPAVKEQVRSLILPKKYFDRETQLQKTGRVSLKSKVVKRMTISAMPDGFRRKGDRKVVLTAKVKDLGLNDIQKKRLIAIAGTKYLRDTDSIKIIVRMFETPEEGEVYAKNYLYELVEAAKNDQLEFEPVPEVAVSSPLERLERLYSELNGEDEQSADALSKWIMYKETGKKTVGADLTYGEGVRDVVYGDKESKSIKDQYGYTIQEEEDEEEFFVPEEEDDE